VSQNTLLSDINEIYVGYILAGEEWYDDAAGVQKQFNLRVSQVSKEDYADAIGKSKVMAKEFVSWAKSNEYKGRVTGVWWTARPGSMSTIVGHEVDQRKNPTDILVQFQRGPADGFLGLSAKSTKGKTDIGFKNPGIGTLDRNLGLKLADKAKKTTEKVIDQYDLPDHTERRKAFIRANPGIKKITEEIGSYLLATLRDDLLTRLLKMEQTALLKYLLSDWMDAEITYPPYVKVTGFGNKEPYHAKVTDPVSNEKLDALSKYRISLQRVGNESIGVGAEDHKIMKIRFKYESEKMASTIKLTGEPW